MTYIYDAAGKKLRKVSSGSTTDYVSGIQYKSDGTIDFVQTEEGLAKRTGSSYAYYYNLKDHLGNVRTTFYRNPNNNNTEVLQQDDYYAFGFRKTGAVGDNKFLYNGKELQDETGLYDYGARFYDPIIGQFTTVDPKPNYLMSSYAAFLNNPILIVDPLGDTTYRFSQVDGKYIGMYDLDIAGQVGSYGSMKTMGKGKDKQEVWDGQRFEFADPVNDAEQIRDGIINSLVFVSNTEMKEMLTAQGAFNYNDKNSVWRGNCSRAFGSR